MTNSNFFDKLALTVPVTAVPSEGSEDSAIPLYEVEFLEFTDEADALPKTRLRGISPWDEWLQLS